jgi:hypothetical protein
MFLIRQIKLVDTGIDAIWNVTVSTWASGSICLPLFLIVMYLLSDQFLLPAFTFAFPLQDPIRFSSRHFRFLVYSEYLVVSEITELDHRV